MSNFYASLTDFSKKTDYVCWSLLLLLFCLHGLHPISAQTSADNIVRAPSDLRSLQQISGLTVVEGTIRANVHVKIKNTNRQTLSNEKGYYTILGSPGETLTFSFMGQKTVEVIIEDVTKALNVRLYPTTRKLTEVELNSSENSSNIPNTFDTYFGKIDRQRTGFATYYIPGENLNSGAINIAEALVGKVPGYRVADNSQGAGQAYLRDISQPALWEIDGVLFEDFPPFVNTSDVIDINIIKSPAGLARYGSLGKGGVIIVKTRNGVLDNVKADKDANGVTLTNENYYKSDAIVLNKQSYLKTAYQKALDSTQNSNETAMVFDKLLPIYAKDPSFYLDTYQQLQRQGANDQVINKVFTQMQTAFFFDPVGLKSLAYTYQQRKNNNLALKTYQRIISLRPDYAQSYRDLAHAHRVAGHIEQSWKYYLLYLIKSKNTANSGIEEIIYQEMEEIYYRRLKGFRPTEKFQLQGDIKNVPKDLRIVVEWDNSEAEFNLEFVNPDGQAYSFLHNYEYNDRQIIDEKTKGYSSKQFMIDKLEKTGWLINLTYLGNKTSRPSYLKLTVYKNWAQKGQTEEIHVVKLVEKNKKFKLLSF